MISDAASSPSSTRHIESDAGVEVLEFLRRHDLSSLPVHYWVVHEHLGGRNRELGAAIDDRLRSGSGLDAYFMQDVYEQFVSGETFRRFSGMGDEMRDLLGGLIDTLRQADQDAAGFQEALQDNIALLDGVHDTEGLKSVVRNLAGAAMSASESNQELKSNLAATQHEARALREQLEKHRRGSITDPLTGLFNRRGMEVEMGRAFEDAPEKSTAMLVLDIDHFKKINDAYGHTVGDVVIRKVAETLRGLLPSSAVPARFGGEEFVILLSDMLPEQAQLVGEHIRQTIERLRLVRRQDKLAIGAFTISVGVAIKSADDTLDALFMRAYKALYEAKSGGRNRVACSV